LIALAAAMGIGRFAFTPVLPMMQVDAGVTIAAGAWLASANYIGYLVGSLSALVWRVQPSTAIRTGLTVIGLSTVGMGFEHDVAAWALLRFVAGVGSALVLIFVFAWSADQFAHHRRHWFNGIVFAGTGAGITISGGLCLALVQANATSTTAWISLGALASVFAVIVWFAFGRNSSSKEVPGPGGGLWSAESLRLIGCYGLFGYGYIIPATFLPVMARGIVPDPSLFGWAWPIFGSARGDIHVLDRATQPAVQSSNHLDRSALCHGCRNLSACAMAWPSGDSCRGDFSRRHSHGRANGGNA